MCEAVVDSRGRAFGAAQDGDGDGRRRGRDHGQLRLSDGPLRASPRSTTHEQLLTQQCKKTDKPRCHFIDPVTQLAGKIAPDGIHPTDEGYDILGQMVWDLMKAEGVRR